MKKLMLKIQLLIILLIITIASSYGQKFTGLTATASSGNAAVAIDNNIGTRWESAFSDPQWITVDLGEEKVVGAIKLYWEGANAKDYTISFSTDGSSFGGTLTYSNKAAGTRTDIIDNVGVTCRYIKMNGTARNLVYGYSIWEFEVYPPVVPVLTSLVISPANSSVALGSTQQLTVSGLDQLGNPIALTNSSSWSVDGVGASITSEGLFSSTTKALYTVTVSNSSISKTTTIDVIPSNSNLSIGKTATASSGTAATAIDNNIGTRWESAFSDPQWIMVDLGVQKNISDIFVVWEGANSRDYIIETSNDNSAWTTIITKTAMPNMARTDRMYDLNAQGRYVRLTGTARNLTYGHSIWEFKIYGTDAVFYRSTGTGNWSDASSWETSTDNLNWTPSATTPPANANAINIQSNQAITLSDNVVTTALTLQPGAKLTVNAAKTLTANSITLNSDATGTATFVDNGTATITTATVQQYLPQGRNWYITSPVVAGTTGVLNTGTEVRAYNEITKVWDVVSGSLTQGRGYISVSNSGSGTSNVSFSGTLNTGTISVPLTRTGTTKPGFNLVGNPYPSYLDWSLVSAANPDVATTMWFRTKTSGGAYTFSTYNTSGNVAVANGASTTITKYIPPMQAFWVRVNANKTSTDFSMTNAMRSHADVSGNRFKAPVQNAQKLVRLEITNGVNIDEAVLYFNENAIDGFDNYDSQKMSNGVASMPEIYTKADNQQLVINGMQKFTQNSQFPLGYTTGVAGVLKLKVTELDNFDSTTKAYLIDNLENTETELTASTEYSFNSAITTNNESRFSLQFRAPGATTGVGTVGKPTIQVFVNATNQITIIAAEKSNYAIYNAVGQLIEDGEITSNSQTSNFKLTTGVYMVKVNNQTTRVIVK